MRRSDEPGAWYAMLPLEVVYAFDPVPPEPQHEEPATPMSRSGDGDSDGSGMDVESASNGMGDGGGVSVTPAYADWTLPTKDAHHIIGGQASDRLQKGWLALYSLVVIGLVYKAYPDGCRGINSHSCQG